MDKRARSRAMEQTVADIQQRWGVTAIRKAADPPAVRATAIPTGYEALDRALAGIGGLPRGRHSELIGCGTAGHWSVAAQALAQAQAQGQQAAYVDLAATADAAALARCGVQLGALTVLRPRGFAHALAMTGDLLRSGAVGVVVFDRLHDLTLAADGDMTRALDRALRDWTPIMDRTLGAVIWLTETASPGLCAEGGPLPFFATLRLGFERQGWIGQRERVTGFTTEATVIKNKLGAAGQRATLRIALGAR